LANRHNLAGRSRPAYVSLGSHSASAAGGQAPNIQAALKGAAMSFRRRLRVSLFAALCVAGLDAAVRNAGDLMRDYSSLAQRFRL